MVETRFTALTNIVFLAPACLGDEQDILTPWLVSHSLGDLIPTQSRHTDIQQDGIGFEMFPNGESVIAAINGFHAMSFKLEYE